MYKTETIFAKPLYGYGRVDKKGMVKRWRLILPLRLRLAIFPLNIGLAVRCIKLP